MKSLLLASVAATLLALSPAAAAESTAPQKAAIGDWGVDTKGLSKTIKPGDDFYRFVNDGWLKTAKIPEGLPYNDAFVEVYLSTEQRVAGIIEAARQSTDAPGSPEQLIGDYHRSHANMERRNALGITPIASNLAIFNGLADRAEIARVMAYPWMDGFIGAGVLADAADPKRQIAAVGVGGLTMPSRDYYLAETEPYIGTARRCSTIWHQVSAAPAFPIPMRGQPRSWPSKPRSPGGSGGSPNSVMSSG
jgi:putative endopeptidase